MFVLSLDTAPTAYFLVKLKVFLVNELRFKKKIPPKGEDFAIVLGLGMYELSTGMSKDGIWTTGAMEM